MQTLLVLLLLLLNTLSAYWNRYDVANVIKISSQKTNGNGPVLTQEFSFFGSAVANIGDLDGGDNFNHDDVIIFKVSFIFKSF